MSGIRFTAVLLMLFCIGGCKIRIEVPVGGSVVSESGAISCSEGEVCEIDVVDVHFNEVLVATAEAGFTFGGWAMRDRGLCGGSLDSCALSTEGFDENELLLRFLESPDEVFFLEPVFNPLPSDAFDTALFEDARFTVLQDGLQFNYRFRADGTYSFAFPPFFASGEWEFRADNTVIFFSKLADTDRDDLIGYAVFRSFSASDGAYTVCFIDDQSVRSVAAAVDICENGSGSVTARQLIYRLKE